MRWSEETTKRPTRRKRGSSRKKVRKLSKGGFHLPFNEFRVAKMDDLLRELERVKPKGAKIEVSTMEDTPHMTCMQALTQITVQNLDLEGSPGDFHVIYQYCPVCKVAVRIL